MRPGGGSCLVIEELPATELMGHRKQDGVG